MIHAGPRRGCGGPGTAHRGSTLLALRHPPAHRPSCFAAQSSSTPMPCCPTEAPSSPRILSLNGGAWRFRLFEQPEEVPAAFADADFDASQWAQASSPASSSPIASLSRCSHSMHVCQAGVCVQRNRSPATAARAGGPLLAAATLRPQPPLLSAVPPPPAARRCRLRCPPTGSARALGARSTPTSFTRSQVGFLSFFLPPVLAVQAAGWGLGPLPTPPASRLPGPTTPAAHRTPRPRLQHWHWCLPDALPQSVRLLPA